MSQLDAEKLEEYLSVGQEAALQSGEVLRRYWGQKLSVQSKGPCDFVTNVDKESERVLLKIIKSHFSEHAIIAEESGTKEAQASDFCWVVDPLDGTTNYIHQYSEIAISIALLFQKSPVVGIVYNPIRDEMFTATKGGGATFNGTKIAVSEVPSLEDSLLCSGFFRRSGEALASNTKVMQSLVGVIHGMRVSGAAALSLAYVAAGSFDGCWYRGLKVWDEAAGVLLIEEAGGTVSAFSGSSLRMDSGEILATNGKIHDSLSQVLQKANGQP